MLVLSGKNNSGFTLVEVMTSIAIFTMIVTFGLSALLISNNGFRQVRSEGQNIDTASFLLESIARRIRTGSSYDCNPGTAGLQSCNDVANPGNDFQFSDQDGRVIRYQMAVDASNDYYLQQTIDGVTSALTNPDEIYLKPASFMVNVFGASDSDLRQPRVIIGLVGETVYQGDNIGFALQTTVTQRLIQEQE